MSCRDCGCFTLFKDICKSCQRASFIFEALDGEVKSAPEVVQNVRTEQINTSQHFDTSNPNDAVSDKPVLIDTKGESSEQAEGSENVAAVAAKLGINLGDLGGVFDLSQLSADIENSVSPEPVVLLPCHGCGQKIKQKTRCSYCGDFNDQILTGLE